MRVRSQAAQCTCNCHVKSHSKRCLPKQMQSPSAILRQKQLPRQHTVCGAERSASDAPVMQREKNGDEEKGGIAPIATPRSGAGSKGRLFSNVTPGSMRHTPGTTFGSAALVAGTTVGAGEGVLLLSVLCCSQMSAGKHFHAGRHILLPVAAGILALPYATQVSTCFYANCGVSCKCMLSSVYC